MVHLESLQEAARERKKSRRRPGWYGQRGRHSAAARKAHRKEQVFQIFRQERKGEQPSKPEIVRASSKKALVRKLTPHYRRLYRKGYVFIEPY